MDYVTHPWGFEIVLVSTENYSFRTLIILEGKRTPYVYHKKQDKTIIVSQGMVQLTVESNNKPLSDGDKYHILPKVMYRLTALKGDATILEVGTKLENDVVVVEE
jgi:mannose-6-phosphate isomerase-like protein (cupin superfamily)